jgi:hypothetical protein
MCHQAAREVTCLANLPAKKLSENLDLLIGRWPQFSRRRPRLAPFGFGVFGSVLQTSLATPEKNWFSISKRFGEITVKHRTVLTRSLPLGHNRWLWRRLRDNFLRLSPPMPRKS